MPLYEFYDEELGESYEMMMTIANKEKYLKAQTVFNISN